jgi:hypothetical protein
MRLLFKPESILSRLNDEGTSSETKIFDRLRARPAKPKYLTGRYPCMRLLFKPESILSRLNDEVTSSETKLWQNP